VTYLANTIGNPLQGAIFERVLKLPRPLTRKVNVTKNIRVPMPDGVELVADLYEPVGIEVVGTVMSRTPYGRVGMVSRTTGVPFAERGFNVLIQSVRGTHGGSGGKWEPFINEEKDGLATLDWIENQPWYNGKLFTFGPSYVGMTQLAILPGAGDRIAGAMPMITGSSLTDAFFPGGAFFTALAIQWIRRMTLLERSSVLADFIEIIGDKRAQNAMRSIPLKDADLKGAGKRIPYYQDWLIESVDLTGPYWTDRQFSDRIADIIAPVHMHAGWHDFMLPRQLEDFAALVSAGREPFLTVGPWTHISMESGSAAAVNAVEWFTAVAKDDPRALPSDRVRLYVQGADEWRTYESYPPVGTAPATWHLQPSGDFGGEAESAGAPRRFRWDPTDPTPDFGGSMLDANLSGRKEQNGREARPDVLVYTCEPLVAPFEVIGPVSATIKVRTSVPFGDVFVRLCDVDENGVSINVCDGIQRLDGLPGPDEDGVREVNVGIWPTAYQFGPGHRLRVQVCGGSFPHFARNTGSGEPLGEATTLVPVEFEILAGSSLTLSATPIDGDRG